MPRRCFAVRLRYAPLRMTKKREDYNSSIIFLPPRSFAAQGDDAAGWDFPRPMLSGRRGAAPYRGVGDWSLKGEVIPTVFRHSSHAEIAARFAVENAIWRLKPPVYASRSMTSPAK